MHATWRAMLHVLMSSAVVLPLAAGVPASADEDENDKVEQGLGVYLGVLPAGITRGHPKRHPEAAMHGGVPSGAHENHIVIAIFNAATGARIENATVAANVSGHVGGRTLTLEPMTIAGTVTYGNFVNLPGNDRYDVRVDITVQAEASRFASISLANMCAEVQRMSRSETATPSTILSLG